MSMQKIAKIVAKEGLIGLQKLEAQGIIRGYYQDRFRNITERGEDGFISFAIAKGIGRNSDPEKVKEMITWLEDAEYLIDYGYIFVSLLRSVTYENPSSLEESKYMKVVEYLRFDDDGEKFDVNFLLDYNRKFRRDVIKWLEKIEEKMILGEGSLIVRTRFGYSYIDEEDCPYECRENIIPYADFCSESGVHYSRYWGISCVD